VLAWNRRIPGDIGFSIARTVYDMLDKEAKKNSKTPWNFMVQTPNGDFPINVQFLVTADYPTSKDVLSYLE